MNQQQALLVGAISTIGSSLCCVAPLVLLSLGIGGAWVTTLTAFEPLRPIFIGFAFLFIGLSFHKLYLSAPSCEADKPCADEQITRRQRLIFWGTTIPLIGLLAFPWFAPLFY